MTLDAGGTNFEFSALTNADVVIEPIRISVASGKGSLEALLKIIIDGFTQVKAALKTPPDAISFSFPGPAEYELGIIGDLQNIPSFRGGVALGPMLEEIFQIPVFINNDGDLFAYGEAIGGLLPVVNRQLEEAGSAKRYRNLLGITFGTGFGGGIVSNNELFTGDNSAQGEINRFFDRYNPCYSAEESVTIRAIKRMYTKFAGLKSSCYEPADIYDIAMGKKRGNKEAAQMTFKTFAEAAGSALANAASLVDGIIVLGGGISNAYKLFMPDLVKEMNKPFSLPKGGKISRMEVKAYNLNSKSDLNKFLKVKANTVEVPFSKKTVTYDPVKRIGVGVSTLGTEKAISLGAYYYAINHIKNK